NASTGVAIQISGRKNATQAMVRRTISRGPLRLFTTGTARLRCPCGARMTTITMLAARTTAFANQGFMGATSLGLLLTGLLFLQPLLRRSQIPGRVLGRCFQL